MKVAIRYFSVTGHTKMLADAIGEELDLQAKPLSDGLYEDVDLLFLGTSIYGNTIDPAVNRFFSNLDVNIGMIVSFSSAGIMNSAYNQIKDIADLFDISIASSDFHCPGEFAGINKGRPDMTDVKNIKLFVKEFINE